MDKQTDYYSPADVAKILNISKSKALEIFHMFERYGKLMKFGPKTLRVEIKEFNKWVECQKVR